MLFSPASGQWMQQLGAEDPNVHAALRWCIANAEAALGLRLTAAVWMLWYTRGYAEGLDLIEQLLALPTASNEPARATSLVGASLLALMGGDARAGRSFADQALAGYRALGDQRGMADALLSMAFSTRVSEDYPQATVELNAALALARDSGHEFIVAAALHHLGMLAQVANGNLGQARRLLAESLDLYGRIGLGRGVGLVLASMAEVAEAEGSHAEAATLLHDSLTAFIDVGERLSIPSVLDRFAGLALAAGNADRAARLSGAAAAHLEAMAGQPFPSVAQARIVWASAEREALGAEAFQRAWDDGWAMTLTEAAAFALGRAEHLDP